MNIQEQNLKKLEELLDKQKKKIEERLRNGDYDGVITTSRTSLEGIFHHIYFILLGTPIPSRYNDLRDKFNLIKKLLSLDPNKQIDGKLKTIFRSISSIISQIEDITNIGGDKHFPLFIPKDCLANFLANLSRCFGEFLYSRLKFLYTQYPQEKVNLIYNALIKILDSPKRGWPREKLLKDEETNHLLLAFERDPYVIRVLINKFIGEYEIECFRENDIFFAVMRIFFEYLEKQDIEFIWRKCKDNDQTWPSCGHLLWFLFNVQKTKPEFISQEMNGWINKLEFREYINRIKNIDL